MQSAALLTLEKANLPAAHARAIVEAIEMELVAQKDTLATKLDLTELRQGLEAKIGDVRVEIGGVRLEIGGMRVEIGGVRAELAEVHRSLEVKIESGLGRGRSELAEMYRALEVKIESGLGRGRSELAEVYRALEVKIEGVKSEIVRWVFVCILGQTAAVLAWATFFVNHATK